MKITSHLEGQRGLDEREGVLRLVVVLVLGRGRVEQGRGKGLATERDRELNKHGEYANCKSCGCGSVSERCNEFQILRRNTRSLEIHRSEELSELIEFSDKAYVNFNNNKKKKLLQHP